MAKGHSRHGWTTSGVPSSSTAPAGSSRSFPAIPASSAVCRCLQVRLLSKNHPVLEPLPVELVEAKYWKCSSCICSHSSNIITTCVHTARTVLLHLFLFEFTYALLLHCTFRHRCSLWLPCGTTSFGGHCHLLNQNQNCTLACLFFFVCISWA